MEDICQGWRLWGQPLRCSAWGPEPLRRGGLCPPAPLPPPLLERVAAPGLLTWARAGGSHRVSGKSAPGLLELQP